MRYHQYYPMSQGMSFGIQDAYDKLIRTYKEGGQLAQASITDLEKKWVASKRPYYRVPPETMGWMLRQDIGGDPTFRTSFHYESMSFNFAEGHELHGIHSILAGKDTVGKQVILSFSCQGPWKGTKFCCLPFPFGKNVVDIFEKITDAASKLAGFENRTQVCDIVQLLCCAWCTGVEPEVLARDEHKELTFELVERAQRRGKIGWRFNHRVPHEYTGEAGVGDRSRPHPES